MFKKGFYLILALIIGAGISGIATYGVMSKQETVTPTPVVSKNVVSPLRYTLNDVKTLKTGELKVNIKRLSPSEYTQDIMIEKWAGDNLVIAVPNSNPTKETGLMNRYNRITLLDGRGIVAQYDTDKDDVTDINLLPDRMVLKTRNGIAEIDYTGKQLYGLKIDGITHSAEPLPNGDFLIVRSNYDQVVELNREGKMVWEWDALENIQPFNKDTFTAFADRTEPSANLYSDFRMAMPNGDIWTHINAVQKLSDGYLLSLRNLNMVLKVDNNNKVQWTFGALQIKYQHRPRQLANGNLLIYDNGNGRVVEFNRVTGQMVFEYPIYSAVWGTVDKLDNGDYIFPSCFEGIILEVNPQKEIVKKVQMGKMPLIRAYPASLALEWIK